MALGYKKIAPEIKAEIIQKVKDGEKVVDVTKQYGIYHKTIYLWMGNKAIQTKDTHIT